MATFSGSGVVKWPPRQAPNCDTSEPMPICRNPIAPEAVPAASGRTLMAPAAEFDITKALANITIIWVPNSHDGAWLRPVKPQTQVQQAAGELQREPEPDQSFQRMARREAHAEQIADQVGEAGGGEPRAIFGAGAAHLRHHDIGSAAGEGEDDLRGQHLAQHVADEGAAGEQAADIAAKSAACGAVAARLRQRQGDRDRDRPATRR